MPIDVATQNSDVHYSGPVVLIVLIIAGVIYIFGYLRAVMHRANDDYKKTKALVPTLRKGFWKAWWAAVKIGFWVAVAVVLLGIWVMSDVRAADEKPAPAPVVSVRTTPRSR